MYQWTGGNPHFGAYYLLVIDVCIFLQLAPSFLVILTTTFFQVLRPSNLLLFHLSVLCTTSAILDLCSAVPSLFCGRFWVDYITDTNNASRVNNNNLTYIGDPSSSLVRSSLTRKSPSALCQIAGAIFVVLNPMALWNIAGIQVERFISISHPLR